MLHDDHYDQKPVFLNTKTGVCKHHQVTMEKPPACNTCMAVTGSADSPRGIFHDLTVHLKCTKVYIFATLTKKIASNSINHSIRFQSVTSSHFFHVFTFLFRNIGTLNFVFFSIFGSTFAFRRRMSILKKSCKLYAILIAFFGFCGCLSTPARTPPPTV